MHLRPGGCRWASGQVDRRTGSSRMSRHRGGRVDRLAALGAEWTAGRHPAGRHPGAGAAACKHGVHCRPAWPLCSRASSSSSCVLGRSNFPPPADFCRCLMATSPPPSMWPVSNLGCVCQRQINTCAWPPLHKLVHLCMLCRTSSKLSSGSFCKGAAICNESAVQVGAGSRQAVSAAGASWCRQPPPPTAARPPACRPPPRGSSPGRRWSACRGLTAWKSQPRSPAARPPRSKGPAALRPAHGWLVWPPGAPRGLGPHPWSSAGSRNQMNSERSQRHGPCTLRSLMRGACPRGPYCCIQLSAAAIAVTQSRFSAANPEPPAHRHPRAGNQLLRFTEPPGPQRAPGPPRPPGRPPTPPP